MKLIFHLFFCFKRLSYFNYNYFSDNDDKFNYNEFKYSKYLLINIYLLYFLLTN